VFFQLALASFCKLLPGLSHLLQVLAMRRRGGSSRQVAYIPQRVEGIRAISSS
jgi:hypothetical protein